jgi:hypothetical protein
MRERLRLPTVHAEASDRGGMMALDIRSEHYSTQDRLLLIAAGDALVSWAYDIVTHEADGRRWARTPNDDAVLMSAQLGWLLSATTTTLEQASTWYTRATDNARRRAAQDFRR